MTVAGRDVDTWEQFFIAVGTRAGREIEIGVLRDGKQFTVKVTPAPQTRFEIGDIGVLPDTHPHVAALLPGAPAEKAGLKVGDVIHSVDGATITLREQLIAAVSKKANTPVTMAIVRNGAPVDVIGHSRGESPDDVRRFRRERAASASASAKKSRASSRGRSTPSA